MGEGVMEIIKKNRPMIFSARFAPIWPRNSWKKDNPALSTSSGP